MSVLPLFAIAGLLLGSQVAPLRTQKAGTSSGRSSEKPSLLRAGDSVRLTVVGFPEYSTTIRVVRDGSISGNGFGRIPVANLTLVQVERLIAKRLAAFVKNPRVFLSFEEQIEDFIYVVGVSTIAPTQAGELSGAAPSSGTLPYEKNSTLLQLLAGVKLSGDPSDLEILHYRDGALVERVPVKSVLAGLRSDSKAALKPRDLVVIQPIEQLKIWVSGAFKRTGEIQIRRGVTLEQAVGLVGGIDFTSPIVGSKGASASGVSPDLTVAVRRGEAVFNFPAISNSESAKFQLESGDTLSIITPKTVTVVVSGQVALPGSYSISSSTNLLSLIGLAGNLKPEGSLKGILVFRKGTVLSYDLSGQVKGEQIPIPSLEEEDLVYVQDNPRILHVLGEVKLPGRILFEDNKTLKVADAVARVGGLTVNGSYRRMIVMRPNKFGKLEPIQFNLDEFLKDGKAASNPELRPGDILYVNTPRNRVNLSEVSQIITAAILLGTINR